jgi:hypothetical protein
MVGILTLWGGANEDGARGVGKARRAARFWAAPLKPALMSMTVPKVNAGRFRRTSRKAI